MGEEVWIAFLLTLMAGLATGIGSLIAFFTSTTNTKFLSWALGFSAGVMIFISFVEIFPKALEALTNSSGVEAGKWLTVLSFFCGMLLIAIIDRFVPNEKNPHEVKKVEDMNRTLREVHKQQPDLLKMGTFTALAIAIHNFPEGIATFASALHDPTLGIAIAIAVAIHNIPEGIAVSVPVYYATGSRKKAFKLSFLSGLAEPLGAVVAFLFLMPYLNEMMFGFIFAAVAGIMVFISLDELLPAAREYDEGHSTIYGVVFGMAIMAVSIILFM
ncbi:zinc transporter ZupT [Geomicrobium sp. JCM 19038]|uniref:zinc transporter ZupT n=1 Tax=Geomicrobium sp. JCM 19038 TaxID=1460635 RepID=UPI00045F44C8|nr:zinc transporter ZupT [Geomicrobium sp. JCM 19038]GAK07286.1 metal transporter, ZIP family [Geomicrobium sp. JCM 19038]